MRQADLDRLAREEVVEGGVAPACVLGVSTRSGSGWRTLMGAAGRTPDGPVDPATLFDLASVSKPFVAATFASLVRTGRIQAETPLGALLPECRGTSLEACPLELLLSHRAGLVPHRPLFQPLVERRPFVRKDAILGALAMRPVENTPGDYPAVYSDLGYLLTGIALERTFSLALDALVRERVAQPLALAVGSAREWLAREPNFLRRVAPTERVPFRGGLLRGVVHDENAWAFAGHGLAGHAGLFGTVECVLGFGAGMLDALAGRPNGWLDEESATLLVRERPKGSLRLGFDGKSGPESAAGPSASARTFGHLGFTGTSLWCDPTTDTVTVLLTNRVCPTRANIQIRAVRPRIHEALFAFGHRA